MNLVSTGSYSTSPYVSITNGIMLGSTGLTFATWYTITIIIIIITVIIVIMNRFKSSSSGSWARIFELGNGAAANSVGVSVNSGSSTNKLGYFAYSNPPGSPYLTDLVVNDLSLIHI